jgi:hypothetical protein
MAFPNRSIDDVQARLAKAASAAEKERYTDLIRQLKAYQTEMQSYTLELPTITFAKSHVIKDANRRPSYRIPRACPHCRRRCRVLAPETRGRFR